MYRSKIIGTGSGLPEKTVTNEDLSKLVGADDEWITSRTGIKERRIATRETTSGMAVAAAKMAIERAGIAAEDIDLIIVSTCTPDYETPSAACIVQRDTGAVNAAAFDVAAACSGFVYAYSVADKFIKAGIYKTVLVIGSELLSKFCDWSDKKTCVLFGDGAGAVVLQADESGESGIIGEELGAKGKKADVLGNGKLPPSNPFNDVEPIKPEDTYIFMDGLEVFGFATRQLRKSMKKVLSDAGMTFDDVKYIVPHQANMRIIEFVAKKLDLPMDKFYLNLDRFGNTSSASIPIAFNEMVEKGLVKRGDVIIMSGFGGGLTWGTVLFRY